MATWTLRLPVLAAILTAASATCPSSQWKQYGDMCYWRSNLTMSWSEVRGVCQTTFTGSDMVSIHDLLLDAFIGEELMGGEEAWLGLHRPFDVSPWTWTDGSAYDYHHWYGGTPDWPGEACAVINYGNDGDWTGFDCYSYERLFMCQIEAS